MRLILTRGSDQSLRATRVKHSLGSFNVVRRREFFFGDEEDRVNDNTRGRVETTRHEKLNDESPTKGLPVRRRRDAYRAAKKFCRRVGGCLSCRPPEMKHGNVFRNYAKPGGLDVRQNPGPTKPLAT